MNVFASQREFMKLAEQSPGTLATHNLYAELCREEFNECIEQINDTDLDTDRRMSEHEIKDIAALMKELSDVIVVASGMLNSLADGDGENIFSIVHRYNMLKMISGKEFRSDGKVLCKSDIKKDCMNALINIVTAMNDKKVREKRNV